MGNISLTKKNGQVIPLDSYGNNSTLTQGEQRRELMGENIITLTVLSASVIPFAIGDSIAVFGQTYYLNQLPTMNKMGKNKYEYNIRAESIDFEMLKMQFFDADVSGVSLSSDFFLTGKAELFLQVLVHNMNDRSTIQQQGERFWIAGACPDTEYKNIAFSNENCMSALQKVCEEFNLEFEVIVANEGLDITVNLKKQIGVDRDYIFRQGAGNALYTLTRETANDTDIVTRLYAFGGEINIPPAYRGYSMRLKLPGNESSYIEDSTAKADYGLIEKTEIFNEIYPQRQGTISDLGESIYKFRDWSMEFNVNDYLAPGLTPKIEFLTGKLAGFQFELSGYHHTFREFTLAPYQDQQDNVFPNDSGAFEFAVGDKYTITDILMPQSYIDNAEQRLLLAAQSYLEENSKPRVQYSVEIDQHYAKNKMYVIGIGDRVQIIDNEIPVDQQIRVKQITRDIINPNIYVMELSNVREISLIQSIVINQAQIGHAVRKINRRLGRPGDR